MNNNVPKNTAVALGFFDGVHLGHRTVIAKAVKCKEDSLIPTVYTFKKSPSAVLNSKETEIITENNRKEQLIKSLGVEEVIFEDFLKVKDLSPEDFIEKVLKEKLKAKKIFCGFNYHFGKGGEGTSEMLEKICPEYGIEVFKTPPVTKNGKTVSSSIIRNLIKEGKIEEANILLNENFAFSSFVKEGNHLGTKMGIPTINQSLPQNMVMPKFGVYLSVVNIEGECYTGVTNIGVKPTVGEFAPLCETFLPKYCGSSLYNKKIEISLIAFLRNEKKFSNIEALYSQIKEDTKEAIGKSPLKNR